MLTSLASLSKLFASHPLTREAQFAAWRRFASWQLKSRLRREVVAPWIAGQRLAVRRGMLGATGNIYLGLHEFADMMVPLHFLREGDLFLDIGANVGSYTVLASGVRRATTWAFEPDPKTSSDLRRNIAINDLAALVTVHECALGPTSGEVAFTVGRDTVNKVASAEDGKVRIVRQARLDDIVGGAKPIMIKMDVEGYEEEVLRGAEAVLARASLRVIEMETVTPGIESTMTRHRFARAYYDPLHRSLSAEPVEVEASNALYVRDSAFVQGRLTEAAPVEVLGRSI